ncbi:heme lyase NrfEFG subunit NrfF [Providencia rustigianii]|uniref:heme lyase NrfEFG subunit NrfF n=1 Tax=Providencia rustigianii TaxID=158850 RepID=UPI000D9DB247|nr:heme lyase NrfEFG subunit NrfF [Providencia rustigianii]SPY78413.1 Formate-dependent nitrite reductase complex subunit nrfG [Providencia rustigianii]
MVKFIVSLLLLICTFSVHAQIVDTWQFSSSEEQEISLQIASQLRCPQCQNQNLLESNAPTAVSMRHQVFKMVAEGKTESQIIAYMTERYGNFVLYNPPFSLGTSLLWLLPLLSIITILFILWRFGLFKKKNNQSETSLILIDNPDYSESQLLPLDIKNTELSKSVWFKYHYIFMSFILVVVMVGYFALPRFQLVLESYQVMTDPMQSFTPLQQETRDLQRLQDDIRQTPDNSELWATLGEYYLYQNSYQNSLIAYRYALQYSGENAQLYSAIAAVLYYQAGQQLTDDVQKMIDKALSLDENEVTALMLLASDAFMNANYATAINIWQTLLDNNSSRINRAQIIEAIQMAKLMENNAK